MHILMINHEFPPLGGGGATAAFFLSRELAGMGHKVTVVTSHLEGLPQSEDREGVTVHRLPCGRKHVERTVLKESFRFVTAALLWARRWCLVNRVDIVQTFFALPNGPVGHVASRTAKCPHCIRISGGDLPEHDPDRYRYLEPALRPVTRWLLSRAHALVVNSRGFQVKAKRYYPHLDFVVIPNGVDTERFQPPAGPGQPGPPLRLLFVSRIIERKGLQFLLPALADVRRQGAEVTLDVVGDGPMRPAAEQRVTELGLGSCVRFAGLVPREKLPTIYQSADVFVLPSLSEGMPNVVLEAMASGLPIIGTRVPGTEELVQEGRNGWLVEPGDVQGIADATRAALSHANLGRLGASSRLRAKALDWRSVALRYEALYCQLQ